MTKMFKIENLEFFVKRNISQLLYTQNPLTVAPFFPVRLYVEPTNACNLRCIHCHHNDIKKEVFKRKLGMMNFEIYKKIIDEIKDKHCEISLNAQGEPLLNRDIIKMVRYAEENKIFVSLLTNATLLSEEKSKELIDAHLDRIVFSFDAVNKEQFESIRKMAHFEKTLLNILKFIKINEESGHCTFVCCSVVVQNKNAEAVKSYDDYFYSLPVDAIFHSSLLNLSGNSGVSEEIDTDAIKGRQKTCEQPICRVPWEMMTINWDGEVSVCGLDFNVLYSLGNIRDFTLAELWNSKRAQIFRKAHLEANYSTIEQEGYLCSRCNCLYDEEYNLRNYKVFAEKDLLRKFNQYSVTMRETNKPRDENKYRRLLQEIERLKRICQES